MRADNRGSMRRAPGSRIAGRASALLASPFAWLARAAAAVFAQDAGRAALWVPVPLGFGVWLYLEGPSPAPEAAWIAAFAAAAALWAARRLVFAARALPAALALIALGFGAAQLRANLVASPVLERAGAYEGAGRIIRIDRAGPERRRLTLDHVALEGVSASPSKIRVTLAAAAAAPEVLRLGRRIGFRARLTPPPGPAEPGAFDFRRAAWFARIGAVGRVDGDIDLRPAQPSADLYARLDAWLLRIRADISEAVRAAAPGSEGAVMAALIVGDRSALDPDDTDNLRDANLSHLLAISGLHMGLVCMTVFGCVRLLLAATPGVTRRGGAKKTAAAAALFAGAAYLALSGGEVATQRAFAMAAVAFGAIWVDRQAVTLRAVAAAATVILLFRPESLLSVGFQLSFAATTAMVAFFEATRGTWRRTRDSGLLKRAAFAFAALAAASAVAGFATAPFVADAFNRVTRYGLIANLAAMPAMGIWIMPSALAAAISAPFGLHETALQVMAWGVRYVLAIAEGVSSLPAATAAVPSAPPVAFGFIVLAGLLLCLPRGPLLRGLGVVFLAWALLLWSTSTRPDLLIAPKARLLGVLSPAGRVLDRPDSAHYAAQLWLRRDGDAVQQSTAAARAGFVRLRSGGVAALPGGVRVELLLNRRPSRRRLEQLCRPGALLIAPRASVNRENLPKGDQFQHVFEREATRRNLAADRPRPRGTDMSLLAATGRLWRHHQGCLIVDADRSARLGAIALSRQDFSARGYLIQATALRVPRPWRRSPRAPNTANEANANDKTRTHP